MEKSPPAARMNVPLAERLRVLTSKESWFGRAPADFRAAVLAQCEWRSYEPQELVYRVVDESGDLYGIADGSIELYSRFGPSQNPLMMIVHEGLWFGVGPLLSGGQRRVTAVVRTQSVLARVPATALRAMLAAQPQWWRAIGTSALEYGDITATAYGDMLIADTTQRCAAALLRICGLRVPRRARPEGASAVITRSELAALVNVSRPTLVPILKRLESDGLIEQGYRTVRIRDAGRLQALVSGDRGEVR